MSWLKNVTKSVTNTLDNKLVRAANPALYFNAKGLATGKNILSGNNYVGKERKAEAEAQRQANLSGESIDAMSGTQGMGSFLSNMGAPAAGGAAFGTAFGNTLYGQNIAQTGQNIQDIIARRRGLLEGNDLATNRLRQGAAQQAQASRASAIMAGQRNSGVQAAREAQIRRQAGRDIASTEFAQQQKALDDYQSLIGNVAGRQGELTFGGAGLGIASQRIQAPNQQSAFGTVICTELYRQGYMSEEVYREDQKLGTYLAIYEPEVMKGYHFLAMPIVEGMRSSKIFTKLVSIFALPWARHISGDKNILGATVMFFGKPLCKFTGMLLKELQYGSK